MKTEKLNKEKYEKLNTVKLSYKGAPRTFDTYKIPITHLYFNDLNGRIATFISQYQANKDHTPLKNLDRLVYNKKIRKFVLDSNSKNKNEKTKNDIKQNGQRLPGVVLEDGRIIDGNRRFALLNELHDELGDSKYSYFEATILPVPETDDDRKAIKLLELEIQIGGDEKVGYEPIDTLVDIYLGLVKEKLYTDAEYARITGKKESQVKQIKGKAELMADFLSFWNVPEQFHLANDLKLDGPLQELVSIKNRIENEQEWAKYKVVFYTFMFQRLKGDVTREVRNLGKLYGTPDFDKVLNDYTQIAETVFERAKEVTNNFSKTLYAEDIRPLPKEQEKVKQIYDQKVIKINNEQAIEKPNKLIEKSIENLEEIDVEIVSRYDSKHKKRFIDLLEKLISKAEGWKK